MLAAARTKSIREAEEVLLIDMVEDGHRCVLDDLVLQCSDPERTFPPVGFLDSLTDAVPELVTITASIDTNLRKLPKS